MVRPLFFCLLVLTSGCATYQREVDEARNLIGTEQSSKAIQILEPLASKDDRDQLVHMLDYAVALQQSGRYQDSAKILNQADRLSDIQDYTSLSKETASILLTEELVQYKGDDYEKILINAINAINYLMMGDLETALVQVRRLNNKLYLYKSEAKKNYEQNSFAFYVGAIIWEADKKYDEAYIFYKKAYELIPDFEPLKTDLVRAAIKAQRPDDVEKWRKMWPEIAIAPEWKDPTIGELVLIYQQGWGPRKQPNPSFPRVPKLFPTRSFTQAARVEVTGHEAVLSRSVYSVQDVAIKTLDDQYAALIAKRVAGIGAKAVVADQIRQKNQLLGQVAWIAMNLADRADLRQWSTLPQTLQVARLYLKAGQYNVTAKGISGSGSETGEVMPAREVTIKPGKKTFLGWRSFR